MMTIRHYITRLDELTRPDSIDDAAEVLGRAGYKLLGKGSEGRVFAKPGDPFVLKLFSNRDSGYPDFVRFAQAHPNKHFPVFKGNIMRVNDQYSAVRVERLYPSRYAKNNAEWFHAFAHNLKNGIVLKMKWPKSVTEALTMLVQHFAIENKYFLDLGVWANTMKREDGTLVFADPVAFKINW